jgi:signal transduction histidine kinase
VGPLRRNKQDRLVAGVASGLSARIGVNVTTIRIGFVIAALISGFGIALYVFLWLLVPEAGDNTPIASRAMADRRGIALAAVTASVLGVVFAVASMLGAGWIGSFAVPIVVAAAGLVLIWRNCADDERAVLRGAAEWRAGGPTARLRRWLRVGAAAALLISGVSILLAVHASLLWWPDTGLVLLLSGVAVLLGPWWLRVARDLMTERKARIQAEERADIAARVHDSVLQTLALIQRRADQPHQVIALARAQERELRSWLFDGKPPGSVDDQATTVAAAIRRIQQDVEAQHGVSVEAVTVGDADLDDDLAALLAAAREATVNAAKWSGAPVVSLFAEVEPESVAVYVRDRGQGFDPAAVSVDRKGIAESVRARMARHGGHALIRSAPGAGTEVTLAMPRAQSPIA